MTPATNNGLAVSAVGQRAGALQPVPSATSPASARVTPSRAATPPAFGSGAFSGTAAANAARRQPVAAHGWSWPSQTAAARALGVSNTFLHYTLQHGTFAKLVMRKLGVKG